jgi:hypothetical protein
MLFPHDRVSPLLTGMFCCLALIIIHLSDAVSNAAGWLPTGCRAAVTDNRDTEAAIADNDKGTRWARDFSPSRRIPDVD